MNFNLLRPVVFTNLKVNEVLKAYSGLDPVVAYKGPNFAVLRFKDGSEGCYEIYKLETIYKLAPLCWVEERPVYPGNGPLYYKDDPTWKHNEEGVIASGVRDDELHFHGGIAFPIADATWTKPEPKRIPSFQVEDVNVFPGDTVYYYGSQRNRWGITMTVKNGRRVVDEHGFACIVDDYNMGSESFRLKPQLVIGDRLVPMPEREALKQGQPYWLPNLCFPEESIRVKWSNEADLIWLNNGLIHLNKEAAIAHGEAIIALSRRKD